MNRTTAAQRLWTGSGIVAGRLAKRTAGATWPVRIGAAVVAWKAGPAILDQAHQQPWIMPAIGAGWAWAAWLASNPNPGASGPYPDGDEPSTSKNAAQKDDPESGGVAGKSVISTAMGTAYTVDDPDDEHRTHVRWIDRETA